MGESIAMKTNRNRACLGMLFAGFLAGSMPFAAINLTWAAQTTVASVDTPPAVSSPAHSTVSAVARLISPVHTVGSDRGVMRYREIWGIDNLKLEPTASGSLIRFSYRVLDPQKAQVLNDKKTDPYLLVDKTGQKVGVESAERIGKLRQTAEPESGRQYWMMFGNPGHLVRPGDRVDVVVGGFHAFGLFVEAPQAATFRNP
jgi:hypothetical protein